MKNKTKIKSLLIAIVVLITSFSFVACEKEDIQNEEDSSLIIVISREGRYAIVSPTTGAVLQEVEPAVVSLEALCLGYQSEKAIILSKKNGSSFEKVLYSCDRETGNNLFQITSEQDFDVLNMDVSPVGQQIVFTAQKVDELSDDNIHKINEDGTAYEQLTFKNEGIDCPDRDVSMKLIAAYDPVWSPDGSKVVFNGHLREIEGNYPHNCIIMMDEDGENKQILFDVPLEDTHFKDICWTQNSQFLLFIMTEESEVKNKVLHVNTQNVADVTTYFTVEGLHTDDIWTSPNANKVVFNKYEPGGGDLYVIDYTVSEEQFQTTGSYQVLAEAQSNGLSFGSPDWQFWNNQ